MNPLEQVLSALRNVRGYLAAQRLESPPQDDPAGESRWPGQPRIAEILQRQEERIEMLQRLDTAIAKIEVELGCGLSSIPKRALRLVVTVEADGNAAAAQAMRSAMSVLESAGAQGGGAAAGPGYNFAIHALPARLHAN